MRPYDDSTGKAKATDARGRSAALSAVFILGICLGVVISERLYLATQEEDTPAAALAELRSRKLELGGGAAAAVAGAAQAAAAGNGAIVRKQGGAPTNALEGLLREVAPQGEVIIVISNMNLIHEKSLVMWIECMQRIPSKNWLVIAIDEELRDYCKERGINHYYRPVKIPKTQANGGSNHAISAMKYEIVEEFLALGWHILLSDVDIVTVQDPLAHLHRDADVEGMSDGFDPPTAYGAIYGVDDATMGWSRYAQGTQHMALNSGLFYLRASARTLSLMRRIAARLRAERAWDQSVYNEEIFFLSHGDYSSHGVTVRVMEYDLFMNSKTLFKFVRHRAAADQRRPVMVHMNYHPDKTERMAAAIKFYLEGDKDALKAFPGGSEPGS